MDSSGSLFHRALTGTVHVRSLASKMFHRRDVLKLQLYAKKKHNRYDIPFLLIHEGRVALLPREAEHNGSQLRVRSTVHFLCTINATKDRRRLSTYVDKHARATTKHR